MLPACLFTVTIPSETGHCAGLLSFNCTHSLMSVPPNRTIASEGGAANVAPGVTTRGTGVQNSVSSGFICAERPLAAGATADGVGAADGDAWEQPTAAPPTTERASNEVRRARIGCTVLIEEGSAFRPAA